MKKKKKKKVQLQLPPTSKDKKKTRNVLDPTAAAGVNEVVDGTALPQRVSVRVLVQSRSCIYLSERLCVIQTSDF